MEKKPTIRPAADFVLIKRDPEESVSAGGIIIPAAHKYAPRVEARRGTVVAVGPGRWATKGDARVPLSVKPGDRVYFSPVFQGIEQKKGIDSKLGGEELMLRHDDIWAVESEG